MKKENGETRKRLPLWLRILLYILGSLLVLWLGFFIYAYIPSPKFEPLAYAPIEPDYWPTEEFKTSTPEEQGMDSAKLVELLEFYQEQENENPEISIDSITIVRNGYQVMDAYLNPMFPKDSKHVIHSCTKSILSALIGIAIDQGNINSVEEPVISFFEAKELEISDPGIAEVTLQDLLTMQTGIRSQDSYLYRYRGLFAAMATDDWVASVFELPMDTDPGKRFDYSNLSSFLLSAIIQETTGMDTLSFAYEHLFGPMGIDDVYWETSPQGIYVGFARMWLKPEDMAKFGLLYLQQGQWDGQQLISETWIKESITPNAYPKNYVNILDENGKADMETSRNNWISSKFMRPFSDGYGYQWWLDRNGSYTALGTSGQYIMVLPEENMVIVITNSSSGMGAFFPYELVEKFILPAIQSEQAIKTDADAQESLKLASEPPVLENKPGGTTELPDIALEISGNEYSLEKNNWNNDNFKLDFDPELDHAVFSYTAKVHDAAEFQVGLDGAYRFTDTEIGRFAARGSWISDSTFEIEYQQIGYSAPVQFRFMFEDDKIFVDEVTITGITQYTGTIQ